MSAATALLLFVCVSLSDGAKILAFFPIPSISHHVVFRVLTTELAKRGHEVTVITPDPAFPKGGTPANYTEIDVHDISYNKWNTFLKLASAGGDDLVEQMEFVFRILAETVEMQLNLDEVQKLIKEENFDLLLLEACVRPALLLSSVVKAPVILVSSFGPLYDNIHTFGASGHYLLYPDAFGQRIYNLTKWEKVTELVKYYGIAKLMNTNEERENKIGRRLFGPNIPTISELRNNVDMLFLNIHHIWEGNRPVPPSVIFMGGLHQKPVKELSTDLKTYLDSSRNGVIYVSFGTNVKPSLLPPDRVQLMTKVFSQLPYDVLWKWDTDELPGRSKNIRLSKWLPQSDLLRHPKIKVFITQCGLQSTDEAITAGVPLIGFPMISDQWYNAEKFVYHGIGAKLNLLTLTEEVFRNTIETIINDKSFRRNIAKLASVMNDQPMPPLERAVWWTEHVLRHGGAKHLRSPAANMSWAQYLELELVLSVSAIIFSSFSVFLFIVYKVWKTLSAYKLKTKLKGN